MTDEALIDENGKGIQFNGDAPVTDIRKIQPNVFLVETAITLERKSQIVPKPGQFYMLRKKISGVYFKRPISVYHSAESEENRKRRLLLQFLILEKGEGTREICSMLKGELLSLTGPCGSPFVAPEKIRGGNDGCEICIVGGGIGVAPVADFASSLPEKSYDFYASFKSGSYGLEHVNPRELVLTTDDGSEGIKGMLPTAFTSDTIRKKGYKIIYACGPTPMLAYVKKIAEECGVLCYLSLEHRMLCGLGACLGCTIQTKSGTLRVCKEGPVFDSREIDFPPPPKRNQPLPENEEPDLSVTIKGVKFKNPVIAASGTFGYGQTFRGVADVAWWGGISSKGTTFEPREGNPGERSIEESRGDINSIGLQNPGMEEVCEKLIPEMMRLPSTIILNLAGHDLESYVKATDMAEKTDVPMIELNISCPNVKAGGQAWGMNPDAAFECVSAVRAHTKKVLMVKLSPNAPDLRAVAMACVRAGADALSLVNTFSSTAIDIETGRPFFNNIRAGYCGPAIKPIALRLVYDVAEEMNKLPPEKRVPIVGLGGIEKWQDAVEFIMAGSCAVQVGSANFVNPDVAEEIVTGLRDFMRRKGYRKIEDFCGLAHNQH
ncbi:MAG: dihydroorotate dehydrogenase [Treponema sp.]|nr:dihydroorotate dehydrogenase [Treponema sp.]